jgi:hypothetical protein
VRLAVFRPAAMFQAASVTRANRYPEIFAFVRSQLGEDFNGRILSFGCSTGEELMTLRAYFPHAPCAASAWRSYQTRAWPSNARVRRRKRTNLSTTRYFAWPFSANRR